VGKLGFGVPQLVAYGYDADTDVVPMLTYVCGSLLYVWGYVQRECGVVIALLCG
jgi:hypothetical protein